MFGYYGHMGNIWPFGIGLSMGEILVWGAVILIFVAIFRGSHHSNSDANSQNGNHTALDILKERYAKGEINKKEFDGMKKDISG
jgi:putative membrane protein